MDRMFRIKSAAGDILRNLGPSMDFSLTENMPADPDLTFFLDKMRPRGFPAVSSVFVAFGWA
jgi:hypothetical protein